MTVGRKKKFEALVFKSQIKELYNQGKSISDISQLLNADIRTIKSNLEKLETESLLNVSFDDFELELKTVKERIDQEIKKEHPSHLLINALTSRQMELSKFQTEMKASKPFEQYEARSHLTDIQVSCIADIISEPDRIDLNKPHWQRILNGIEQP